MYTAIIIDDEIFTRKTIKKIALWEKNNVQLAGEASNGIEALKIIKTERPQIMFLDMKMPGMDGISLMKILREHHYDVYIIVVSGYDDFIYTKQAIVNGAKDYLLKPINREELNCALSRAVSEIKRKENAFSSLKLSEYDYDSLAKSNDIQDISVITLIHEFIQNNYFEDISLSRIADMFHVSKEYVCRAFKKTYAINISNFINLKRIEKAKELLQKNFKIKEVSEMVGFNNINYFNQLFKKYNSMTPSDFKELF